ncbi:MAG: recombinase family protein [Lachnospiraceae bacterium]|nr:recombinase family protein [Lachnospiraceae bacterium]
MTYGYARVSTVDQHEDRQVIALIEQGVPEKNIYIDKQSGKDFNRPMYQKLIKQLKANDVLYVSSIDRFGRNYEEILEQWRIITKEIKANIIVLDMPLLNTTVNNNFDDTFVSNLVLQLLSYVSHKERQYIKRRQREGIAAAKAKGIKFGRPEKTIPEDFSDIVKNFEKGKLTLDAALIKCNMSKATFYRKIREYKLANKK